ncbi:MAG: hypothetical protein L6R36_002607 [Xanthoria steineri]|nr:MAG: hypothetical protein L6R36_002607 [Xanthoria steineri]
MPKKRNRFQFSKPPSSVHPSISSHQYDSHRDAESDKSVNDLLHQLRIDQASSAPSTETRPDANPQTVHPSLKHILQIPETPPPQPRPTARAMATHGRRRPPGPPPPRSWLLSHFHPTVRLAPKSSACSQLRPNLGRLGTLPNLPHPHSRSLQHQALVAIAKNWEFHLHYDQYYLPLLPTRHKQLLLTYIATYNPHGINAQGLSLFLTDDPIIEGATGAEGFTHLDLSGSAGRSIALKDLKQLITTTGLTSTTTTDSTPDSWDLPASISPPPTCMLTHLSLAYPPPSIRWRHLLELSPNLNTLTHLSLAYWPAPTLFPNSTTAYHSTPRGEISYGDHNLYSASLDNDFSGPANVLRLLSRDTYCLQWLDLSGCSFWLSALGWREDGAGIDWSGPWSGVTTVVVAQGRIPACLRRPDADPHWKTVLKYRGDDAAMITARRELSTWAETERHHEAVLGRIRDARVGEGKKSADTAVEWGGGGGGDDTWGQQRRGHGERRQTADIRDGVHRTRGKVRFETGWEGWWIEDCLKEL